MSEHRKHCQNSGCAMRGIKVRVTSNKCISCGRDLASPIEDLMDALDKRKQERSERFLEEVLDQVEKRRNK